MSELFHVFQPGLESGDVIIVLQQKYHDKFQRSSDDLVMTHTITLTEALCGFSLVVKHLDGRDLLITHSRGQVIKPGKLKQTRSLCMIEVVNYYPPRWCKSEQSVDESVGVSDLLYQQFKYQAIIVLNILYF